MEAEALESPGGVVMNTSLPDSGDAGSGSEPELPNDALVETHKVSWTEKTV